MDDTFEGFLDETSSWDLVDVISTTLNLGREAVANTVQLLSDENTVPFIARYRKEQTRNMSVDKIREVKDQMEELQDVMNKSVSVIKTVEKTGKMTQDLKCALKSAQSMKEIEFLYAPYKAGSKRSLAERARELGLEALANQVLKCPKGANLHEAIKRGKEGLKTLSEVEKGVQHIIADIIAKDKDTLDKIRELFQRAYTTIETTKSRTTTKKEKENEGNRAEDAKIYKFELYFNFSCSTKNIRPHQVMAINRGENLKILAVKVNIPDQVKGQFAEFCACKWPAGPNSHLSKLFNTSVDDAYTRLLAPLMIRHCRSDLTKKAEKASVEVFGSNLKRLLLTPPVRGEIVLGIDPGFTNGCKYAVTAISGKVLETGVLYLHSRKGSNIQQEQRLVQIVNRHRCKTVAIGNGTACRETEAILSHIIREKAFHDSDVKYCITSESGASIYSASDVAQAEMPDLDVTLRGAVSIARRLQDPLAELVKIEPKHIGVGMYQHDIAQNALRSALDGVVEECVSFVGVDINVGSEMLLRRVAGLSAAQAKRIIEWRETKGPFVCRSQLNAIKGFGPKTFEQCAGFVRVMPETRGETSTKEEETAAATVQPSTRKRKAPANKTTAAKRTKKDMAIGVPERLDMTCIHPESYSIADQLINMAGADKENLGQPSFISAIKRFVDKKGNNELASDLETGTATLQLITDGLTQQLGHDFREGFEKPLFKKGLTSLDDIKVGTVLTGQVTNTTHFGSFVDIGVGRNGLLHNSQVRRRDLRGKAAIELGDRVEVTVMNIEKERGRIGLKLLRLL